MTPYQSAEIDSLLDELEEACGPCESWSADTQQQFGLRVTLLLRPVGCEAEHQRALREQDEIARGQPAPREIEKVFADCEGNWGLSEDWLPEQDERFGRAAAKIMARGPVDRVAERAKRLADLGAIHRQQAKWPGWAWALWRFNKAEQSRQNISAWLKTKRFPNLNGAQLSSAALEEFFKRDCPGQYYQRCHFDSIHPV